MIDLPRSERSVLRPPKGNRQWACIVCGNGVNIDKAAWLWIHKGGSTVVTKEEAERLNAEGHGASDVGYHPVGPCCLKRHPELRPYAVKSEETL